MPSPDGTARDRPLFVLGCPRSGTTLLQLMLHAHPRIAIPPENRFLLPVYFDRGAYGDLSDPENRRKVAESIVGSKRTQFKDFGLNADEIAERIVAETRTVGSAVGLVLRAYAERFDKPRWGDKRPGYHQYVWVIRAMFPDAQFVQLVRDGRDCAASLKRMPWWRKNFYQSVVAWMLAIESAHWSRRNLPPDTFHELRYEDLVEEPEREMRALCDFVGEKFDDAMLTPKDYASVAVPKYKKWHTRTHEDISAAAVGRWETLEQWELELCETVMRRHLISYGYELAGAKQADQYHVRKYTRAATGRRRRLLQKRVADKARLKLQRQQVADAT